MKRRAWLAVGLAAVIAVVWIAHSRYHFLPGFSRPRPLEHRELATRFLGEHLGRSYPGKPALVLANPYSARTGQPAQVYAYEKAGVRGLKAGLGEKIDLRAVVYPDLKPEAVNNPRAVFIDPTTTTPLSYLVAESAFEKVAKDHPTVDLWVSLIGLPVRIGGSRLWTAGDPHKFALLLPDLRVIGGIPGVREGFKSGKLAAIILNKPGSPPEDQPLGKDLQSEFDSRFLLVTPENVDRMLSEFPRAF